MEEPQNYSDQELKSLEDESNKRRKLKKSKNDGAHHASNKEANSQRKAENHQKKVSSLY